ncbi:metallophosphoesterase family protein [candidate division KSB1 bacterium]|nr:metallophosphoesterase family protein [candidate division KSB1 bacterium]
MLLGLISDTHGYFNPKIVEVFNSVDLICHAGDIGNERVIHELVKLSPLCVVHGNIDYFPISIKYPKEELVEIENQRILLIHQFNFNKSIDRQKLKKYGKLTAVFCGHTHRYSIDYFEDIQIINPGSAGKGERFEPPSVMIIEIVNGEISPKLILLGD